MKRLLLTGIASFAILFAQAQCQADFQYTSSGLNLNLISTSINAGSTLNSQTPTWNFGDGSPQVTGLSSITHTYQNAGVYNVCIEIFTWPTSWTTCSSIYCDSVLVGNVSPASWDCDGQGNCSDPGTGNGQYSTQSLCQSSCIVPSWDCDGQGNCSDPGTGNGQYISLSACQSVCGVTTVTEEHITKMGLLKTIDLLGKETEQKNQLLFYIYDDGTVEKRIIIE